MNIACTACPARYGVADEKISGKRVRITCKRCGTVLVVDGTVSPPHVAPSNSIAPGPPARAASAAPPAPAAPPPEPFLVAFADEHQERADVAQIVRLHRAGRLGPDSLVWREGMANWQSPWDVEEIASAFRRMGYARPSPFPAGQMPRAETGDDEATSVAPSSPHAAQRFDDEETTSIVHSSRLSSERSTSRRPSAAPASSPVREDDEVPTHVARSAPTSRSPAAKARASLNPLQRTAERPLQRPSERPLPQRGSDRPLQRPSERPLPQRSSDRPQRASTRPGAAQTQSRVEPARRRESTRPLASPLADRFARQAYAGAEEDDDASQRVAAAETQGLMDATDESQRLTGARNETSVLFSLDSLLKKEQTAPPPARRPPPRFDESLLVDANASLPTGGSFVPGLAAPDFTAPITAPPPQFAPASVEPVVYPRADNSRKWMVMTGAVVLLSAAGFAWTSGVLNPLFGKAPAPTASPVPAKTSEPVPSASPPPPAESAAPEASAAASASAEPSASAPATATAAPKPAVAAVNRAPTPRAPSTGEAPEEAPARPSAPEETEAAPTPAPAATPAAGGGDFDASAAKTALTAAAGSAASCKESGGPTGSGRVSITFAPSGRPTSVAVTGDLAGTTVGSCVARLFRQTRVPSFSGEPVTVAKSFSIE